jgi:hypothetical protein
VSILAIIYIKKRYSRIEIAASFNQITTLISVSSLLGVIFSPSIIEGDLMERGLYIGGTCSKYMQ